MLLDASFTELKLIDQLIKFLPLIVGILIFSLGYFLKYLDEKRNILTEIEAIQSFCLSWLNTTKTNADRLFKSVSEYSKHIENVENKIKNLDRYNLMLNEINELKSIQIYKAFVTNKKGDIDLKTKLYFDFRKNLDVINLNYNHLNELLKVFGTAESDMFNKWDQLDVDFRKLRSSFKVQEELPDYILYIFNCYAKMEGQKVNSLEIFMNNFVLPFFERTEEFYKKYPNDDDLTKLFHLFDDFKSVYSRWQSHRKSFSENFQQTIDRVNNSYENVTNSLLAVEKLQFKILTQLK
jgi:archaellum component FlaC